PKTSRSRRTITMPRLVVSALRDHRVRQLEERLAASTAWHDWDLVFATTIGTPLDARNVSRAFADLLTRAGLPRIRGRCADDHGDAGPLPNWHHDERLRPRHAFHAARRGGSHGRHAGRYVMTTAQTILLVVGTILELAGIGLAVLDTLDIRKAFARRDAVAHVGLLRMEVEGHGAVVNVTGEPPTVEERLVRLEAQTERLQQDLNEQFVALRKELREEVDDKVRAAQQTMDFQVQDIRRLLGVGVQPNLRRTLGFGLFAIGLLLQTTSNFAL
ncbi:MAG: hypothetical protein LC798_06230, partial [Chloroflexi bacterium]|nr:hypothetical protein [Chloroflexota bacterium]